MAEQTLSQKDLELIEDMFFAVVSDEELKENFDDQCRIWRTILQTFDKTAKEEEQ